MRKYVRGLIGETLYTVAQGQPNTVIRVSDDSAIVETRDGYQNPASLSELQELADRVWSGEVVEVERRGRSAFHMAVLADFPEVEFTLNPRRAWLRDPTVESEYEELFPDEDPATAREGRIRYAWHRSVERKPELRRTKIQEAMQAYGRLVCEVCGFDYVERYGVLGNEFIECHHTFQLAAGEERETALGDLVLLCANCHRMVHKSKPMLSPDELGGLLYAPPHDRR